MKKDTILLNEPNVEEEDPEHVVRDEDEAKDESVTQQDVLTKDAHLYPKRNRKPPILFAVNELARSWS